MNVAIVGLGLIGGSFARALKRHTAHSVWGEDLSEEVIMLARLSGAIDGELTDEELAQADFVLIALRPQAAIEWAKKHAPKISKDTIVIDLCGVKRAVVPALTQLSQEHGFTYVGGHPMAGSERAGFVNSRETLFNGASMILTPLKKNDMELLEELKVFFLDVGFSSVTFTTPEEHDKNIAFTSQLAHVTSSAYIKSPTAADRRGFSAGSYQDLTRVAFLDEDMWTELFFDNKDFLLEEINGLINHLTEYRDALSNDDKQQMTELLADGKRKKIEAGGH